MDYIKIFKFIIFTHLFLLLFELELNFHKIKNLVERGKIINEMHKSNQNKETISISYALDNNYIYPTIVSMTSLVLNVGNNTFYDIYILHPPDFTEKSKQVIKSIEDKYPYLCQVIFINMMNFYKGIPVSSKIPTSAYYRLSLQDILPDVQRIIYLDGDTLVFEDLKELIQLDMKGNVILGFLDSIPDAIESFGFKNATVLNSGVLLIDLENMRKYGYSKKIEEFISKNKHRLNQQDQTVINVVMQERIAPLPPKFGIWDFDGEKVKKEHLERQWPRLKYNKEEFYYAFNHPAIIHFVWPKPFWRLKSKYYYKWWDYARTTGYYYQIIFKSPIPKDVIIV